MKTATYKDGIKGKLLKVQLCKTGSIKVHIDVGNGRVVQPLMHHKFPQLQSVLAKANAMVGCEVQTKVSQTTDTWKAGQYFCDLNEV